MRSVAFTGGFVAVALLALSAKAISAPAPVAAPAAPPASFAQCAVCHSVKAGENKLGPSLHGVFGRKVGMVKGFTYSPAMKSHGGTWTAAALDTYLTDPRKAVPGNRMSYMGQKDAAKRAELIAYLKTLK
ncbi:MAG: c-type cytochrome [Sphingobium sp.]|nr:c-type cytochrome [Sphingobium sp.]